MENISFLDQINFKSEAWKFSPKQVFQKEVSFSEQDFIEQTFFVGPGEENLEEQTWSDLKEQGYVKIEKVKECSLKKYYESAASDKVQAKSIFSDTINNSSKSKNKITFLKSLPSPLWLVLRSHSAPVEFFFEKNVKASIVFLEAENQEEKIKFFPFDFSLDKEAQVDVFSNMRSSGKSIFLSHAELKKESRLRAFQLFGGNLEYKRFDFKSFQTEENSEMLFAGVSLISDKSCVDYHTDSFHLSENQQTNQLYKTIGSGAAKNIFGGRVHLTQKATGAEVDQLNKNILLGKKASIDTQPELNIDQDDVKATHGAATSALDEEHFFYLASRGYPMEQSRRLLLDAFCKEVLFDEIPEGVRSYFVDQMELDLKNV